jgi:putative DNA methylase
MTTTRKKLIEVALPLEAINIASAREKSIRHGHPSTLHLWWARRPLAAARAVIFAQMVDDPSAQTEAYPTAAAQEARRQALFELIEQLVQWENTTNETVLERARAEIRQSWAWQCLGANAARLTDAQIAAMLASGELPALPAFHDPFAGGGALPLEAQRLGLESFASDLNPVAVLINKAMIEIPPKFAGKPPVNPAARQDRTLFKQEWRGAAGLADDVRYYGQWMRDEAEKQIGHLYPQVEITAEMVAERPDLKPYQGRKLTVIAWLWARTVKSPNPAFANVEVPLASTFMLSTKTGKEAYVEPVIEHGGYRFTVKVGKPRNAEAVKNGTKLARGANFRCVMSGAVIDDPYIKAESMAKRMGERLMAIVAEGERGRVYLSPTSEHEILARQAKPKWKPDQEMNRDTANLVSGRGYGFFTWSDLFTPRQLVALTTFSDLVLAARERVRGDAVAAGLRDDGVALDAGGTGAQAYADAVAVYLALAIDKASDYNSALVVWSPTRDQAKTTFARQALPMVWDYGEINPLAGAAGDINVSLEGINRVLAATVAGFGGHVSQSDAQHQSLSRSKVVSTDPPYYDNIGYADLSDFFYVWLRRSLRTVMPNLFATLAVPKTEELVATPYRHGSKLEAEAFFLEGMTRAMHRLAELAYPSFPVTIYYAFKQSETESNGTSSTGWETFLDAVIDAGLSIGGTWPIRTERDTRSIGIGTNALASSIVLVCRRRPADAPTATRREFVAALQRELPAALAHLQRSNIAPVDLAQAAIGPGMAIYTRYGRVLDASGHALPVRAALALINETLDMVLAEQEGDFDADTRWALAWFEQFGFHDGEFGVAETLSKAKNTSVSGMMEAGIVAARAGKVQLLRPEQLAADWDPASDKRLTVWEMVHHLVRALDSGERAAAELVAGLGSRAETARELAYRLYTVCERKKRAQEALAYNALVQSWPEIVRLSKEVGRSQGQERLL